MSPASLFVSVLLSVWLWQAPPPPYGLPRSASAGTDTTAPDGTRTITYTSQGNRVEVRIGPDGATTETITPPGGNPITINYKTVFNQDGTRTETRDGGGEVRTVGANGRTLVREVTTEEPVEGDSTTTRRTISKTEYDARGRPIRVTEATELHGLVEGWDNSLKHRTAVTKAKDANGNDITITEEVELILHEGGIPTHRRTTITNNADGTTTTVREVTDPRTGGWIPEPPPPPPEPEPEPEEPISEGPARRAGYVALSPGIIHIALPDSVGYQWGLRGGVEFPCGGPCAIAAGLSFQHSVASANAHELRTQAEVMPGARLLDDRLFVFGDVALGHVANTSSYELMGMTNRFTSHGVALGLGAGVSYAVWRELYVGGRFGADLQWFPSSSGTFASHNLALDAFIGYRFGF